METLNYNKIKDSDLVKLAQQDVNDAREQLFYKYEKMIYKIVQKYRNTGVEFEDLKSEAIIGFYYALSKFDTGKKIKFGTYSTYWIKERVLLLIKNNNRKVAIAYNKLYTMQKIKNVQKDIENEDISEFEKDLYICEKLNITNDNLQEFKSLLLPMLSIDNSTVLNITTSTTEEEYERLNLKKCILVALAQLEHIERTIVVETYYKNKTYKQIKEATELSYSDIKKILKTALEKLKEILPELGVTEDW